MIVARFPELHVGTAVTGRQGALLRGEDHHVAGLAGDRLEVGIVVAPKLIELGLVHWIEGRVLRVAFAVRQKDSRHAVRLASLIGELLENACFGNPRGVRAAAAHGVELVDLSDARAAARHDRMRSDVVTVAARSPERRERIGKAGVRRLSVAAVGDADVVGVLGVIGGIAGDVQPDRLNSGTSDHCAVAAPLIGYLGSGP